ncbi:MAG: hypothetical protein FJ102_24635 [Deltaproteobacteria bacterium]|nr:hypothetical protein [Deltaproteobacteria bacterium]
MFFLLACAEAPPWTPTRASRLWPEGPGDTIPVPTELAAAGWLADVSAWRYAGSGAEGRAERGSFGIGDGTSFALLGLDEPPNTLTNAVGPGYQRGEGFYADMPLWLARDGVPLELRAARVQRPRGTGLVRTRAEFEGSALLDTIDLVHDGVILRHVTVNGGAGLSLLAGEGGTRDGAAMVPVGDVPVFSAEPVSFVLAYGGDAPDFSEALAASRARTAAFIEGAARLSTPDPAVNDLYEGMLLTHLAQTDTSGTVSPMSRYTSGWLRDAEGPIRLYLAAGLFEAAAAILTDTYRVSAGQAAIANSFPLDTSRGDTPPDWSTVPFMDGRNPVEAPSYPVIHEAMYRRATGESAIADDSFLRACVERQEIHDGLLMFSGDETFRYTLALPLGGMPEEVGWSSNSAFLWIAAAESLGIDTSAVRERTESAFYVDGYWSPVAAYDTLEPYPAPFEDVSLGASRLLGDDRGIDAVLDTLLRSDGTLLTDGAVGYTGMVPGYLLAAVKDRAEGEAAFNALATVATPSGHFEEIHTADNLPLQLTHDADGYGADVTARYRPWEGGVVVAAMFDYLVGADANAPGQRLVLSPHLPNGWPQMQVENLPLGRDGRYDLRVEGFEEGMVICVDRDDDGPAWTACVGEDCRELPAGGSARWTVADSEGR